jgi:hypothetical protein
MSGLVATGILRRLGSNYFASPNSLFGLWSLNFASCCSSRSPDAKSNFPDLLPDAADLPAETRGLTGKREM